MPFNPRSAAFRANPYPIYHRLRAQDPIHYRHEQGDWILTRYADMVALLKDNRIDPRDGIEQVQDERQPNQQNQSNQALNQFWHLRQESQRLRSWWIIVTNPPVHTRLHKVLNRLFRNLLQT